MSSPELQEVSRAKMNLETARIAWHELQRFFASGSAIYVDPALDLVEVAYQISEDNKEQVLNWMEAKQLAPVTDAQAQAWHDADADMWAVVVSPYVLVQPVVEPQH
jgi:hypothetical protein